MPMRKCIITHIQIISCTYMGHHFCCWGHHCHYHHHVHESKNNKLQLLIMMLLPYMCQQQIYPSVPHKQIISCKNMEKPIQYINLILTHCNQQCGHKYWYTYISYYCRIPLNKYCICMSHCNSTVVYI